MRLGSGGRSGFSCQRDPPLTQDLVLRAGPACQAALCLALGAPVLERREKDRRWGVCAPTGDGTSRGALPMGLNSAAISRERKLN